MENLNRLKELQESGLKESDCEVCGDAFPIVELGYSRYDTTICCENCLEDE